MAIFTVQFSNKCKIKGYNLLVRNQQNTTKTVVKSKCSALLYHGENR